MFSASVKRWERKPRLVSRIRAVFPEMIPELAEYARKTWVRNLNRDTGAMKRNVKTTITKDSGIISLEDPAAVLNEYGIGKHNPIPNLAATRAGRSLNNRARKLMRERAKKI